MDLTRYLFSVLATASVVALLHTPLQAQTIPSPYRFLETRQEAGLFVAQMNPNTGAFGYGPGSGTAMGARYGIRIAGAFAVEAAASYLPTTRDLVDPTRVEGDRVVGEVDANIVTLDGRLRFSLTGDRSWYRLSPFLTAGGGLAFNTLKVQEVEQALLPEDRFEFETTAVGVLGAGLQWFPSDHLLVRADWSLFIWRLKAPEGFRDPARGLIGVDEKEWVGGSSYSLGVAFRF